MVSCHFVNFLSYRPVLDWGGGQWVLDIAQCLRRGGVRHESRESCLSFDFTSHPSRGLHTTLHPTIRDAEYDSRSNRLPNFPALTISVRTSKLGSTPRRRFD
ncbi:hypothetical protein K443DRAFT_682873 [Laccaria amethystina LaAM-08-1]|uniref:Unplaced genomic scaffold K443scaffold_213, whole genome shotgun sequence n=1 Tax=Laccaria amethystina LaAM-08-1 TaxID=1095629 RepID=A0A0C9X318_9AGAR|nr:hypothetical protein K443DRAFT_682873 [Laccaria amethystina LaAM-08-1]